MDIAQLALLTVQFLTMYNPGDSFMIPTMRSFDECKVCKQPDFLNGERKCKKCQNKKGIFHR